MRVFKVLTRDKKLTNKDQDQINNPNLLNKNNINITNKILFGLFLFFLIFIIFLCYLFFNRNKINSFEECLEKGNKLTSVFPQECTTEDGKVFKQ